MDTAVAVENHSLTMKRSFKHPKQDVYEAWTNKEALIAWFAPTNEFTTIIHEQDLNVGGKYKLEMLAPDGESHMIHGEYVALNPFEQLAFTWEWEGDEVEVNSLVTIDLMEKDGVTEMVLVHDKLESQHMVDIHSEGWTGCLAQLDEFFK